LLVRSPEDERRLLCGLPLLLLLDEEDEEQVGLVELSVAIMFEADFAAFTIAVLMLSIDC
jgi:hypothetical protein